MNRREAAVISAFTGILVGSFSDLHAYAEHIIGHPIWTHEMTSDAFAAELKAQATTDFMAICAQVESTEPLVLP